MSIRWITIVFLLLAGICRGQGYLDLFSAGATVSPGNKVEESQGEIDVEEAKVATRLPLKLSNGKYLILSPYYSYLRLSSGPTRFNNDDAFHQYGLPIGYQKEFADSWKVLLMGIPRLSSDLGDISQEDFLYGGLLLFTHQKREGLAYKYGLYYGQEFFGPMIVPIFGLDWKMGERWRFFGNLPINGTLQYRAHQRFSTGLRFLANVTSFRLHEGFESIYLHKVTNDLYLFADCYLSSKVVLRGQLGRSFFRSMRFYPKNEQLDAAVSLLRFGDRGDPLTNDFSDGNLFGISLIYRYALED
ncbi:MAG: DUF6268 family outer membrane beta-barrel protein [Salibacteraceae bacterium]